MNNWVKILIMVGFLSITAAIVYFFWKKKKEDEPIQIIDKINELERHPTKQYSTRNLSQITGITVHHSASTTWTAEDFARYHVNSKGWPAMGYTYVIEKNGDIIQANPLNLITYHQGAGNNTGELGIVLSGNFDIEQPTTEQMISLKKLIDYSRKTLPNYLPVTGHRDHKATACPGKNLYDKLHQFNQA